MARVVASVVALTVMVSRTLSDAGSVSVPPLPKVMVVSGTSADAVVPKAPSRSTEVMAAASVRAPVDRCMVNPPVEMF
ncbi:hypothetical protein GCM10025876_25100 [Demequina litorisediminis]|uniref:Secreted protein n=1 Tax=Demequina litorisediminis TaxID=1849022 RepID=A0ABQ6IFV5_9MICO|nr:hypothetical protein GCM10025876_25100 [Demequina litorisediminis]